MDGARVATSRAIVERHRRARFLRASSHRARRTTSPGCGRPTTRHGATSPVIAWLWRCSIWCRPYRPSCLRRKHSTGCSIRPSPTVNSIPCSGAGASTLSSLSIAPTESERTVNLVEDCPELLGCVWREADVSQTDLETVIIDLRPANIAIRGGSSLSTLPSTGRRTFQRMWRARSSADPT